MAFHLTAQVGSVMIDDDCILWATLRDEEGNFVESFIDLNQIIGNENGYHPIPLRLPLFQQGY